MNTFERLYHAHTLVVKVFPIPLPIILALSLRIIYNVIEINYLCFHLKLYRTQCKADVHFP